MNRSLWSTKYVFHNFFCGLDFEEPGLNLVFKTVFALKQVKRVIFFVDRKILFWRFAFNLRQIEERRRIFLKALDIFS